MKQLSAIRQCPLCGKPIPALALMSVAEWGTWAAQWQTQEQAGRYRCFLDTAKQHRAAYITGDGET